MKVSVSMKRREFFHTTAAASLGACLPWMAGVSCATASPAAVSADVQATRESLLAAMEASRKETRMRITRPDAQFLHLMVQLLNARKVLEIGTFHGYSSLWMAMGLEQTGGKLVTIEIDPSRVAIAKDHLTRAGLIDRVTCLEGDAHQVAKTVEGPFDMILLDADKDRNDDYFNTLYPKLSPGGVLLLNHVDEFKDLMQNYLDLVQHHPRLISIVLSLSTPGAFSVSFKKR